MKLYAGHRLPPGGVALYYLLPGQTDYSETQKVYATVTEAGEYTFDLGRPWVTGLRIDPDSVGGVPTLFGGIELNPPAPWYTRFLPDGGQWLVLLLCRRWQRLPRRWCSPSFGRTSPRTDKTRRRIPWNCSAYWRRCWPSSWPAPR